MQAGTIAKEKATLVSTGWLFFENAKDGEY